MKAVSFFGASNGVAVSGNPNSDGSIGWYGSDGLILQTRNGGANWTVRYNRSNAAFNGVSCPSANTWIAVGVYEISGIDHAGWAITTDGGTNWRERYFTNITDPLTAVSFIDNNIGTVVGYNGLILRTTDGGFNWNTQTSRTTKNLNGVCFTDENTGVAVGEEGTIVRTINGGINWKSQNSSTTEDLYGVHFINANCGKVVGSNGIILHTSDGGITWKIQSAVTNNDLYSVYFANENICNTVGDNGIILRTTNSGSTSIFEEKHVESPKGYILSQNYPNPFNP
ncbi:MAG TPA: hypothetical protein ENN22_01230, partial [bacterium]|nr:hypothetical protein [bacterium]